MNIKYNLSLILLIFVFHFTYSQNYIEYYNLLNQADSLKYFKKYDEALNMYEIAFEKVDFVHSDKLINAGVIAIQLKKFDVAENYFKTALEQSGNTFFLKQKEFKRNKKKFKNLIAKIPEHENDFTTKANKFYQKSIDSLYSIDQKIRNNNELTQEKDNLIFNELLKLINENGFPSEELVGFNSYNQAKIILHHNLRLVKNQKLLDEYFTKYVLTGKYRPEDYAWAVEQNRVWFNNEKPLYYFQVSLTNTLSEAEKIEINKRRKQIGLKPIEAYKETRNSSELLW